MTAVFLLWHVNALPGGGEDEKFIGVYSTEEMAEQARARAALLPGFRDAPEGFDVSRFTLDEDHWREGFVTVIGARVVKRDGTSEE
jgi:hypothetical protein